MDVIFKKGIPGFDNINDFTIKSLKDNDKFKILEAKNGEVSFVTINPFEVYSDYGFDLTDEIIKELEIKSSEEVLVLSIITLGKDLKSSTMNLQAPLIINVKNNLAKQFIMQNSEYKTKHPLIRRDKYMLVITRRKDESLLIGDDIEIKIVKVEDGSVRLAISAPRDITILRKEVFERVKEENKEAISGNLDILKEFK